MSSRNISSSPAPSADRSSVRATPAARATWPTRSASASVRTAPSGDIVVAIPAASSDAGEGRPATALRTTVPAALQQLGLGALGDDAAVADEHEVVGDDLDLVQQVRGQQDGPALVGVRPEQVAHPADAGRVEPVGRLVEDQHLGLADQRGGDAEPLAHAERVVADPATGLVLGEADPVEHLLDAELGQAHRALGDREDLPAGAAGVLGRGVEQDADLEARGWAGRRTGDR